MVKEESFGWDGLCIVQGSYLENLVNLIDKVVIFSYS